MEIETKPLYPLSLKDLQQDILFGTPQIPNKSFVFDEGTVDFKYVYLSNDAMEEGEDAGKAKAADLRYLDFKTLQPNLLYLNANNWTIKKVTIRNCPKLQTLLLFGNGLKEITFEGEFPKLELLDLSKNALTKIDLSRTNFPKLKHLYLNENKLVDLSGLTDFFVREDFDFNIEKNEPLIAPPKEIVDQNKEKTAEWFRQAAKYSVEKAYEAKILIVGEPSAGKTTLLELLFDRNFKVPQPEQPSTLGIEVKPNRLFVNPLKNLPDIKANIWDFGGQDIQYMLHQYFLTDDSVYILMTDGRSGKTRYGYWFHIINLLGKKSPVLVLLNRNKKSDTVVPFDEITYKEIFPELNIFNCGEIDFGNLNKTWEAFEEKIALHLSSLPVVGQTIIKPWKRIRERIDQLRSNKYIQLSDFEKICKESGLTESADIEYLLEYFHKIGIALNFNDINLQNTVFLDPNWITNAIYDVLSDLLVIDKNGEFEQNKLYQHWLSKEITEKHTQPYTKAECGYLLNLMLKDKFDICYQLPHKAGFYVVPMKLLDKRPEYDLGTDEKLHFRFQYTFMPEGLMSRLIVRLHENILDGKVWLTGAVFAGNDCIAEVLQQETTKEGLKYIGIKLTGKIAEKRRAFLHTIRTQVEYIHKNTFPYINYTEMVVCNCPVCEKSDNPNFYELFDIKSHLEAKETTIFCKIGKQRVVIDKLLHEVYNNNGLSDNKENCSKPDTKNKIFISYSSKDRRLREIFEENIKSHLACAKNKYDSVWSDVEIPVGANWNNEIQSALNQSNIGILLVSPMFLGSEYGMLEFKQMLERRKSEGYIIVPVLLRQCNFQNNEDLKETQIVKTYQSEYGVTEKIVKDQLMPFDKLLNIEDIYETYLNEYFLKVTNAIDKAIVGKGNQVFKID
ncbi:MAG: COR domain-containing protein [Mariniphaga sp.]